MTTVVLVGLIVVLAVAAAYVGLLLVRRWRSRSTESDPPAPWTVGDLVRMRNGRPQLSGSDLFTPTTGLPVTDRAVEEPASEVAGEPSSPGGAVPGRRPSSDPAARADDAAGVVDAGDAPWRRAARMNGTEPGGAWETAPNPVVPPAVRDVRPAEREVRGPAGSSRRDAAEAVAPVPTPAEPEPEPEQSVVELEPVVPLEPVPVPVPVPEVALAVEPDVAEPGPADADPEPVIEEPEVGPEPIAVSRTLSDPDLTPLMGIPLIRPSAFAAVDEPDLGTDGPSHDDVALDDAPAPDDAAVADAPSGSSSRTEPVPPPPRTSRARRGDDEVVSLLIAEVATPPATVPGSPQPVWLRVVRRDGEPVADAVVTLLDDRGQQVDATKTAADGGGELRTPHGGRFLLIAGRDGFQPRAVTLAVDDAPVEVALLLPSSATLAGLVSGDGRPVAGARVVARQEGEVVDEIVTGPDGSYRFDDLAEGTYSVTATDRSGTAVLRVDVRESAELHLDLDLDLVPPGGAP